MSIIGTFPTTIANGQVEDATVVMSLFSWIQAQTNGNACPATTGSAVLKGDGAGATTAAIPGTDYSVGTQGLATGIIKSTTSTGALTIAVSGTDYAPGTSANATGIVKSTTSTGALTTAVAADFPTLNQDTTGTAALAVASTTKASTDSTTAIATTAFVRSATMGNGQSVQNFTGVGGRNLTGGVVTNSTGRPIFIKILANMAAGQVLSLTVGGFNVDQFVNNSGVTTAGSVSYMVPNGVSYSCTAGGTPTSLWTEVS